MQILAHIYIYIFNWENSKHLVSFQWSQINDRTAELICFIVFFSHSLCVCVCLCMRLFRCCLHLFLSHVCFCWGATLAWIHNSIANVVDVFRFSIILSLCWLLRCIASFFLCFFRFIACFSFLSIFSHSQYVNNIRCFVFFFSSPFNSLVFLSKCDIAQFHLVIVVEYFVFIRVFAFGCWCVFWISQRFTYSRIQFIFSFSLN